jgi:hypothetical protein
VRKEEKKIKRERRCVRGKCVFERKKIQREKRYMKENICEKEIIYVHSRKCMREREREGEGVGEA